MTTYTPISENLIATEPENGGEANGNCVVVRRGGKQPGAKEQSQTQVNPIRCMSAASLLANGEAFVERNLFVWHPPVIAYNRAVMYGWGGNVAKEVCVSGESSVERQRINLRTLEQSEPPYERRSRVMPTEQREVGK